MSTDYCRIEKVWLRIDLVVLDDLGYVPSSATGAELLVQFVAALYEQEASWPLRTSNSRSGRGCSVTSD